MIDIVARINEIMAQKGWTGYELSKLTGISTNAIYDWKRVGATPSLGNVVKICEAADITLEQFFCGVGSYNLGDDERRILNEWFVLDDLEKEAILKMIEVFKTLKRGK